MRELDAFAEDVRFLAVESETFLLLKRFEAVVRLAVLFFKADEALVFFFRAVEEVVFFFRAVEAVAFFFREVEAFVFLFKGEVLRVLFFKADEAVRVFFAAAGFFVAVVFFAAVALEAGAADRVAVFFLDEEERVDDGFEERALKEIILLDFFFAVEAEVIRLVFELREAAVVGFLIAMVCPSFQMDKSMRRLRHFFYGGKGDFFIRRKKILNSSLR